MHFQYEVVMSIRSKEPETSGLKDNILIVLFLFQVYNTVAPFLEKKFNLAVILNETVQNNAISCMFIASTFFLAVSRKPTTKEQKIAAALATFLFALGLVLSLAKSWLEKNVETF
jgi:hypothetical protein